MKSWSCSTECYPGDQRERAWLDALHHISLPAATPRDRAGFHGDVASIVSPLGIEFSRVSASPQTISGRCTDQAPSLWLALLIEGDFVLDCDGSRTRLQRGDILYGPSGCDSTLDVDDDFRLLYIKIPQAMLHPRLLNLRSLQVGALSGQSGINRIFAGLLQSMVDDLEALTAEQIRPIEVALSEFMIASLAESSAIRCFGAARASNFHRVCQAIEVRLADCDLSLQQVADEQHASPRYIQKLFKDAGTSFSQYLRQRRLERCRADLSSWTHRKLSISEICFRWGFNDAAHFSRSFRAEFGTTPRAYRQDHLGTALS